MSATNSTVNYGLPQFLATDKPAWLTDFNGAMSDIDTAIKEAKTAGDNAQSTANTNTANIQTLDGTVTSQGTAIGSLQTAVAGNTGSINTINSLIGNGEPTTTDKTIIGAINEINSKVGDVEADDVSFDNANTGLSATDVQAAIVEVKGLIPSGGAVDADDVTYDNTSSGLTATNVQDAIDETVGKFGGLDIKYDSVGGKPQYSTDGGTTWVNFNSAISVTDVDSEISSSVPVTHTLLNSHEELLVSCFVEVFGATGSTAELAAATSLTINNPNATLTKFHESTPGIGGSGVSIILQEYHIEGAEAGDVLTFNFNKTYTTIQAEAHIYAIN